MLNCYSHRISISGQSKGAGKRKNKGGCISFLSLKLLPKVNTRGVKDCLAHSFVSFCPLLAGSLPLSRQGGSPPLQERLVEEVSSPCDLRDEEEEEAGVPQSSSRSRPPRPKALPWGPAPPKSAATHVGL